MRSLASRLSVMSGEGALSVFARAKELERQGRSIIHLELGERDFHPATPVLEALEKALRAGKDRYCTVAGIPALREELAGYASITAGYGGVPVAYELLERHGFQPDPQEIAAKITPRTKAILTCSPNNPTGTVYTDAVQRRIAELAVRHDLYVLSDEIYARIIYGEDY